MQEQSQETERRDTKGDVHVSPTHGRKHEDSCRCWCSPELNFTADNGNQVWVHREEN